MSQKDSKTSDEKSAENKSEKDKDQNKFVVPSFKPAKYDITQFTIEIEGPELAGVKGIDFFEAGVTTVVESFNPLQSFGASQGKKGLRKLNSNGSGSNYPRPPLPTITEVPDLINLEKLEELKKLYWTSSYNLKQKVEKLPVS